MSNKNVCFCDGVEMVSAWAESVFQYFLSTPEVRFAGRKIIFYPLSTLMQKIDFSDNRQACKIVMVDYPLDWPVLFNKNNIEIFENNLKQMELAITADVHSSSLLKLYSDVPVIPVGMPFESAVVACGGELEFGDGKVLIISSEVDDSLDYTDFVCRLCSVAGLRYEVFENCNHEGRNKFFAPEKLAGFSCAIIASGMSDICMKAAQLCAAGIPCVGSDNQVFLRELYPDNFFSLPLNFKAMMQQLLRLNGNPEYHQYIMEKARIQFSKSFSPRNFSARISKILKQIKRG